MNIFKTYLKILQSPISYKGLGKQPINFIDNFHNVVTKMRTFIIKLCRLSFKKQPNIIFADTDYSSSYSVYCI